MTIRVVLPYHLRNLAKVGDEVQLELGGEGTLQATLDTLEQRYPVLRGAVRDHASGKRRPFIRFFACREDLSHEPPETILPAEALDGREPLMIVGAIAGG
jgi:hypothetical protein